MTLKIVVDSLCDIDGELSVDLDLTVVPVYVRFGDDIYRDRVEMTTEEFYHRLVHDDTFPSTTQPTPNDFLEVYNRLSKDADELLVINLSSKLSGTYQSALQARNMYEGKSRIEIIDSQLVVMGLGLVIIRAVQTVREGANLDDAVDFVNRLLPKSHSVMFFDTLKYMAKGGRIGRATNLVGSLLSIKPVLTMKDGEVSPLTRVRSRAAGNDYLYNFVEGYKNIDLLAVEHATTPDEADKLVQRLDKLYPKDKIYKSNVSPVIGTYVGPHVLSVSLLEKV